MLFFLAFFTFINQKFIENSKNKSVKTTNCKHVLFVLIILLCVTEISTKKENLEHFSLWKSNFLLLRFPFSSDFSFPQRYFLWVFFFYDTIKRRKHEKSIVNSEIQWIVLIFISKKFLFPFCVSKKKKKRAEKSREKDFKCTAQWEYVCVNECVCVCMHNIFFYIFFIWIYTRNKRQIV